MELKSNIIVYVLGGLLSMGALSSITNNIRDTFFPPEKTYSKEAVELMLKHNELKQEIKSLKIENEIIEKDNERISKDVTTDSLAIYNSSRAYRDSLRTALFNR